MSNATFIKEFKKSSYYKDIMSLQPYIIYLGGSRGAGVPIKPESSNEESDWDVIVITPNVTFPKFENHLVTGAELDYNFHILIYPLNFWIDYVCDISHCQTDSMIRYSIITMIASLENIIYYNDFGKSFIEYLCKYKKEIAEIGAIKLAKLFELHLKYYKKNDILNLDSWRYYYHLLLAHDIIFNENNKELIKTVRNNGFNMLKENEQEQVYNMFQKLLKHLDTLSIDCWNNILVNLNLLAYFDKNNTSI